MATSKKFNRREFIGSAAAGSLALTVVPRSVIGGPGYVAPSDKLNIGYIGCGTQGLGEMASLISNPALQIVSVCDPNKFTTDYVDWSINRVRDSLRKALGDPNWGSGYKGIPGGRDIGQEFVQKYYAKAKNMGTFKGCSSYSDYRELLEKEKDVDTIKIMTPDHLHAAVAIASMKKGKHVVTHKPIANRIKEFRAVCDVARQTGLGTHLLAWSIKPGYDLALKWIKEGRIGTLKEIHNWSNRPVWPQWQTNPTEKVPVPKDFDWDLWLGPLRWRPFNPGYLHGTFRWMMESGGGQIRDRGAHVMSCAMWWMNADGTGPVEVEATGEAPQRGLWDSAVKINVKYTFKNPDWVLTWNQPGEPAAIWANCLKKALGHWPPSLTKAN